MIVRSMATVVVSVMLFSGCQQKPEPPAQPEIAGRKTLQTLSAGAYSYDLALGPCANGQCPLAILLRTGTRLLDTFSLPMPAATEAATAETVDALWGADAGIQAWSTGSEQSYVGTAVRAVKFAPSTIGLLVTQRYGFDSLKRQHLLLVPEGQKIQRVWSAQEDEGPTWSATALLPEIGGSQAIAYFTGFLPNTETDPDRISVQKLTWDPAAKSIVTAPLPDASTPLFVTVAGDYNGISQARAARAAKGDCLANFFVLSTANYPELPKNRTVIAAISVTRSGAEMFASAAAACGVTGQVSTITAANPGARKD